MKNKILIVNQHGENRGDEAAMRAMLSGFSKSIDPVSFTLLYQYRDKTLRESFDQNVQDLPMLLPLFDYVRLFLFTLTKTLGVEIEFILSKSLKPIIDAYRSADLVVSAPGGPYFGDIYANHELLHWWFIFLAHLYKKPVMLYATSAGPFNNKLLNPIRKWLFPKFDLLITREELSARYLKDLLGEDTQVEVTADSAIQESSVSHSRSAYFSQENSDLQNRLLVAVSLNNYGYPGSENPNDHRQKYNKAMCKLLTHVTSKYNAHLMFFPQLYGSIHSDVEYLQGIAAKLSSSSSWEVIDPSANSNVQRSLFAMCDMHIASRYHPAIFGNIAGRPGLCIFYEHKAKGFMRQLGLDRYAFDIRTLNASELCQAFDEVVNNKEELSEHLARVVLNLQERAQRTTKLAIELLESQ